MTPHLYAYESLYVPNISGTHLRRQERLSHRVAPRAPADLAGRVPDVLRLEHEQRDGPRRAALPAVEERVHEGPLARAKCARPVNRWTARLKKRSRVQRLLCYELCTPLLHPQNAYLFVDS